MNDLRIRVLSAVVMLGVGLVLLTTSPLTRWGLTTLILSVGAWEFGRMVDRHFKGPALALWAGIGVGALGLLYFPFWENKPTHEMGLWGFAILMGITYTLAGFRWVNIESLAPWLFMNLFGLLYLGIWGLQLHTWFRVEAGFYGVAPMLTAYLGIALADIGAYFTGRAFGKTKLCPQISAKKTVEGAVGGTLISTSITTPVAMKTLGIPLSQALVLGFVIALCSIIGDLFISVLKRYTETKDASHLIPGHGGILDRFDSLIFTGPIAAFLMKLFGAI